MQVVMVVHEKSVLYGQKTLPARKLEEALKCWTDTALTSISRQIYKRR